MSAERRKIITFRWDYDRIILGQMIAQDSEEADRIVASPALRAFIEEHEIEVDVIDESTEEEILGTMSDDQFD